MPKQSMKERLASLSPAERILLTTSQVGEVSKQTRAKVEEVIDLLTVEVPEGTEDPIEELKQTLDFILARLNTVEDTTQKIFDMLGKLSRAR